MGTPYGLADRSAGPRVGAPRRRPRPVIGIAAGCTMPRMTGPDPRMACLGLLAATMLLAGGCVRRTITVRSSPPGALVWVNDREVGRTPVDVEFQHYGTYDVRLELEGYEPLSTSGHASPPWWDVVGPDLVAELLPVQLHSDVQWEYQLEPAAAADPGLVDRARELRRSAEVPIGTGPEPAPEPAADPG
jgi:hypothetical protein